jgi:hypothetical protein
MPKEITHWMIARQVAQGLEGTFYEKSVQRYINCMMMGAVFPDALYYLLGSRAHDRFTQFPDRLHGTTTEDVLAVIRSIAEKWLADRKKDYLLAFLAGVITHIQTDALFHGMIFYKTGPYRHPDRKIRTSAVQAHRMMESLIDLYFCGGREGIGPYSLKKFIEGLEVPLPLLFGEAFAPLFEDCLDDFVRAACRSYKIFVFAQSLFILPWLSFFLYAVKNILPDGAKEIVSLMYAPQLMHHMDKISGEIHYQDPLTGDPATCLLSSLFDESVQKSVSCCLKLEECLFKPESPHWNCEALRGEFSLPAFSSHQLMHFSEVPFF